MSKKSRIVSIAAERAKRASRAKSKGRTAWNVMSERELRLPGGLLLVALLRRANELGHQLQDLASLLGVTYGYIAQLRGGLRKVVHISPQFAAACAEYLGVPIIAVKLMAGQVSARDFVFPARPLHEALDAGLKRIESDELLGAMMPASVYTLDDDVKSFILACFEQATTQEVMPSKSLPQLLQDLQRCVVSQADFEVELSRKSGE